METKLQAITRRAKENPELRFTSLAHYLNEDFLRVCFGELKRDKAPGIDGVTVAEYEVNLDENLMDLVRRLKAKRYRPQPVRRVYIPKEDKTLRGLGIPSVEDKIVQMGVKKILEAIFEQDFVDVSYGFRPNRGCHDALGVVDKAVMTQPVNLSSVVTLGVNHNEVEKWQHLTFSVLRVITKVVAKLYNSVIEMLKYK